MSRPRIYDERTGNPIVDNRARELTKAIDRACGGTLRAGAKSRRRRAQIQRAEYPNYLAVVAVVAEARMRKYGLFIPEHELWVDAD